jgi:DNA-binding NarL/FixJ family response regulator
MTGVNISVTVVEPAVAYRRGLESCLAAAGLKTDAPVSPLVWALEKQNRVAIVTLRDRESCDLIEAIAASGGIVVALLPEPTRDAYWHAIRHGAASAVDWNADPEMMIAAVIQATRGQTLLPREVIGSLSSHSGNAHSPIIEPEEVEWLGALAHGATVVALAAEIGYSERAMFRKLHDLYVRLGVKSRSEALVEAERLGILIDTPDP